MMRYTKLKAAVVVGLLFGSLVIGAVPAFARGGHGGNGGHGGHGGHRNKDHHHGESRGGNCGGGNPEPTPTPDPGGS